MPVMLHARDVARWLDPTINEPDQVVDLLDGWPSLSSEIDRSDDRL
jgi:hypothetical protein